MKKEIGLLVVGAMVLGATGTAYAADADAASPLQATGFFEYQYRNNQDKAFGVFNSSNRFETAINLTWKASDSATFFGRVAGENSDFTSATPAGSQDFKMDQYGVKTTIGDWTASIGRQGVQLGQGGTLYAGADIAAGSYFDGVILTNKLSDINVTAVVGKTTVNGALSTTTPLVVTADPAQRWLGLDLNKDITKNLNIGMAFANSKADPSALAAGDVTTPQVNPTTGSNYSSLYGTLNSGAMTYTGEYVRSNASTDNNAIDVSATYKIDEKNNFTVYYFDVKQNSVDLANSLIGGVEQPNYSAFTGGYKGEWFSYNHSFNKIMSMNVQYYALKPINTGVGTGVTNSDGTDNEFAASLKWKF